MSIRSQKRNKRRRRVRAKAFGTRERPRLSVFRSNRKIYGQLIDDNKGYTLVAWGGEKAEEVGDKLAALAKKKKIKSVVFDRGGYKYHGKVKALAEAARKGGLKF